MLSSREIADKLDRVSGASDDRLFIRPMPDTKALRASASSSVDLRLGTWFAAMRQSRFSLLRVDDEVHDLCKRAKLSQKQTVEVAEYIRGTSASNQANLMKTSYVPFGERFILHPGSFVLGVTLEWIRLPKNVAGY